MTTVILNYQALTIASHETFIHSMKKLNVLCDKRIH